MHWEIAATFIATWCLYIPSQPCNETSEWDQIKLLYDIHNQKQKRTIIVFVNKNKNAYLILRLLKDNNIYVGLPYLTSKTKLWTKQQ